MRQTSTFEGWQESQSRESEKRQVWSDSAAARKVTELLAFAGINVNGNEPWDIQVHDERFFSRALGEGSIGVGESYMDGWWDVQALDEFFTRFRRADLASQVHDLKTALLVLKTRRMCCTTPCEVIPPGLSMMRTPFIDFHFAAKSIYEKIPFLSCTAVQMRINKLPS